MNERYYLESIVAEIANNVDDLIRKRVISDEKKIVKIIVTCVSAFLFIYVPITRLVLEMHYFTDVIAGLALGAFCAGGTMLVATLCEKFNILQKPLIKFKFKKKEEEQSNE